MVQVTAIAVVTYTFLDWLKTKPLEDFGVYGSILIGLAFPMLLIAYGLVKGQLDVWEVEREHLREARQHGYESWAEYMAAEGDEFVRDSWRGPAERERNRLVRRLRRLFSRRDEG